jgi:peptidoglycan/xylan/chitin deacetylase (PgdA/CDA1 family)
VDFGAHGVHHRRLTTLGPAEVVREAAGSRAAIEERLGTPITAFAYPYGDEDEAIRHLVGASGFAFGLTCAPGMATWRTPLLGLPRIEVTGDTDLRAFIALLADSV